jgi:hypothetical protein
VLEEAPRTRLILCTDDLFLLHDARCIVLPKPLDREALASALNSALKDLS